MICPVDLLHQLFHFGLRCTDVGVEGKRVIDLCEMSEMDLGGVEWEASKYFSWMRRNCKFAKHVDLTEIEDLLARRRPAAPKKETVAAPVSSN